VTMPDSVDILRKWLETVAKGPISGMQRVDLLTHLRGCWYDFAGATDASMAAHKLDRAEDLEWDPPFIRFTVERHGAVVLGSIYAELQRWTVDVRARTAEVNNDESRRSRTRPAAPRLDVRPLADDLASAIRAGHDHAALRWSADRRSVRVLVALIIPSDGPKETIAGRRKRLRTALREGLTGWVETRPNTYQQEETP
jgi:hypothetical protein